MVLVRRHTPETFCAVAPHPAALEAFRAELEELRAATADSALTAMIGVRTPRAFGLDDGVILPPDEFTVGTAEAVIRSAAAARPPLRGDLNVLVVLAEFPDRPMTRPAAEIADLFFSTGVVPTGSVAEYFREVSGDLVNITGSVVGPFLLPRTLQAYANDASGRGFVSPNGQTMARDATLAALASINRGLDNDHNGFVDAFIIVHAGPAAEETGLKTDIWSHKWFLEGGALAGADGTRVFGYLTVPENSRIGVCAHELGHLLFGWPDLYDIDFTSEGIGNWCLMADGSWNGGGVAGAQPGDLPAHPSAWCKADQGWVNVLVQRQNGTATIGDVGRTRTIFRLWKDGDARASEYFLVENRQRNGFDRALPGDGLLIWHIDDSINGNSNENHYKVALMQADGNRDLERARNRGDAGDPFPGAGHAAFDAASTPSSSAYNGLATSVAVTSIPASGADMVVTLNVTGPRIGRGRVVRPVTEA